VPQILGNSYFSGQSEKNKKKDKKEKKKKYSIGKEKMKAW
jgi:hypothetical protein